MVLAHRLHETLRWHVHAQVDDLEAAGREEHGHDILAQVVDIALHRAENHRAQRAHLLSQSQHARLNDVHGLLHHRSRPDHVGQLELVRHVQSLHLPHPAGQGIQGQHGIHVPGQRLLGRLLGVPVLRRHNCLAQASQYLKVLRCDDDPVPALLPDQPLFLQFIEQHRDCTSVGRHQLADVFVRQFSGDLETSLRDNAVLSGQVHEAAHEALLHVEKAEVARRVGRRLRRLGQFLEQ